MLELSPPWDIAPHVPSQDMAWPSSLLMARAELAPAVDMGSSCTAARSSACPGKDFAFVLVRTPLAPSSSLAWSCWWQLCPQAE